MRPILVTALLVTLLAALAAGQFNRRPGRLPSGQGQCLTPTCHTAIPPRKTMFPHPYTCYQG